MFNIGQFVRIDTKLSPRHFHHKDHNFVVKKVGCDRLPDKILIEWYETSPGHTMNRKHNPSNYAILWISPGACYAPNLHTRTSVTGNHPLDLMPR